eukprot:SAG11_NODE_10293_length_841_cov_1.936658_1_plen_65_part_10
MPGVFIHFTAFIFYIEDASMNILEFTRSTHVRSRELPGSTAGSKFWYQYDAVRINTSSSESRYY